MRLRVPRLRLALPRECRRCGSARAVRADSRLCRTCRPATPLDQRMEARGLTQAEVARRAEVGVASVSRLLAGQRVSDDVMLRVAAVVGLDPAGLLTRKATR